MLVPKNARNKSFRQQKSISKKTCTRLKYNVTLGTSVHLLNTVDSIANVAKALAAIKTNHVICKRNKFNAFQANAVVHTFPSTVAAIGIASKQSLTAFHTFSPHSSPNLFMHSLPLTTLKISQGNKINKIVRLCHDKIGQQKSVQWHAISSNQNKFYFQ